MTASSIANPDSVRWNEATQCFKSGDFPRALSILKLLDQDGEHYASTEIGNLYELGGPGLPRDYEEAAKWYRKAVFHLDDPKAHLALARLHLNAQIVISEQDAFHRHASIAASKGEPLAFLMLGVASEAGAFCLPDIKKAQTYYEKAASTGMVLARRRLAAIALRSGRPFAALGMFVRSIVEALSIFLRDPKDPRLTGLPR